MYPLDIKYSYQSQRPLKPSTATFLALLPVVSQLKKVKASSFNLQNLAGAPVAPPPPVTRWVPDNVVLEAKPTDAIDDDDGLFF